MKKSDELGERVIIPTLQAAVSGAVTGLLAMGLLIAVGLDARALRGGLLTGCTITALTWWALLWRSLRDPSNWREKNQPRAFRVEVASNSGRTLNFVDLPCSAAQLKTLAVGLLAGASLSEARWCGYGKPFSKAQFRELREAMLERGLACYRSPAYPQQGVVLSAVGRFIIQRLNNPTLPEPGTQPLRRSLAGVRVRARKQVGG